MNIIKDSIFDSIGGRKFLGFFIATFLLWFGKIGSEIWIIAFGIYTGANVYEHMMKKNGDAK